MTLEQRLEHMGMDPEVYKKLKRSEDKAAAKFEKWVPKTKEEAQRKWKKMVNSPDHTIMLDMFKKEGLDVLKEGK